MANINLNIDKSYFLPKFFPYLSDYSHRYEVYYGGRSSGKTYFLVQKLVIKGLKEKRFILLMKKSTAQVKDTVWKELLNAIDGLHLTEYFDFNQTEFRATCKINGTQFRCLGLNGESEKAKGFAAVSDVYFDEATEFDPDTLNTIDGTIRSKKYKLPLQLYYSFNPVSKANFIYKYFHFDTGEFPDNVVVHHSTYLDNPRADLKPYLDNLKERDYSRWKIEALGEWATLDKLVYTNWEKKDFNPKDIKGTLLCGLDFGYTNDPTAFVASILNDQDKTIHIFDCFGDTGWLNADIAANIKSHGFAKSIIIADSAEPKSITEIRKLGIERIKPSVKGPDSINSGIQKLKEYRIYVSPRCEAVIEELENYCWDKDKKTNEYINKPIDAWNHYLDALRYSVQCLPAKVSTFDKGTLFQCREDKQMEFVLQKDKELTVQVLRKMLNENKLSLTRLEKLEKYYLGEHDILIKKGKNVDIQPVICNFPRYITECLSSYFCGEPIAYQCDDENALEQLTNILDYTDGAAEDSDLAKDVSIFGVGYELLYIDEDNNIRLARVSPLNTIPVFDDTIEHNWLYGIRFVSFKDMDTERTYYQVEVYSDKEIRIYEADDLFNELTLIEVKPHFFGDVPFIQYKNNQYIQGDFEPVMSLVDAYDDLATNSIIDSDYFSDAYLCLTGTATPTNEELTSIRKNRLMSFPDDTAHAEFLVKPDNGSSMEELKNRVQEDIHKFSMTPNLSDQQFLGNASGVAIRYKMYGCENLVNNKERFFKKGLQRRIELIFNILNLKGNAFSWQDVEIVFHRNLPVNDLEIAQMVSQLQNIVSTETLLTQLPFVDDVQAEMERIEDERAKDPFYNLDLEQSVEDEEDK